MTLAAAMADKALAQIGVEVDELHVTRERRSGTGTGGRE